MAGDPEGRQTPADPPEPGPRVDPVILDAFACRADHVTWDVLDERAVIAVPKPYSRVERWLARFVPGPDVVFVTLDALGTKAWLAADGVTRVRDVAAVLVDAFGADAEPADARAAQFFTDLARREFVRLFQEPRPVTDAARGFTADKGFRDVTCRKCARQHPIRAPDGARFTCPRCRAVNRVA